jgi:hypothetical protein
VLRSRRTFRCRAKCGTFIVDQYGASGWTQTLELEDNIAGLLAFELNYSVDDTTTLFAQGGFQLDLSEGKVENKVDGLGTFDAGETELQAVFWKAGISITL